VLVNLIILKNSINGNLKKSPQIIVRLVLNLSKMYITFMPDIKHPFCQHPKCGAMLQRIYKRIDRKFIPAGWLCPDCGMFQAD